EAAVYSLMILDPRHDDDALAFLILFRVYPFYGGVPGFADCTDAIDVRFTEVLHDPVRFRDDVVLEEAVVIIGRKCLIREKGEWLVRRGPFLSGALAQ